VLLVSWVVYCVNICDMVQHSLQLLVYFNCLPLKLKQSYFFSELSDVSDLSQLRKKGTKNHGTNESLFTNVSVSAPPTYTMKKGLFMTYINIYS
jgi:hypothetical protein